MNRPTLFLAILSCLIGAAGLLVGGLLSGAVSLGAAIVISLIVYWLWPVEASGGPDDGLRVAYRSTGKSRQVIKGGTVKNHDTAAMSHDRSRQTVEDVDVE